MVDTTRVNRILILLAIGLAGCGKSSTPPAGAAGRVTLHGQPLAGGTVVFVPDADRGLTGRPIAVTIERDGSYTLPEPLPPGWYRVALSDAPGAWTADGVHFPNDLRSPVRSGLLREVLAGHSHRFDFEIGAKQ